MHGATNLRIQRLAEPLQKTLIARVDESDHTVASTDSRHVEKLVVHGPSSVLRLDNRVLNITIITHRDSVQISFISNHAVVLSEHDCGWLDHSGSSFEHLRAHGETKFTKISC